MSSPADALREVARIIEERGETHGDYRETFDMCAQLWSVYLGIPITPSQVCVLNALQKFARDQNSEEINLDNLHDGIGFLAIGAAFQQALKEREMEEGGSS